MLWSDIDLCGRCGGDCCRNVCQIKKNPSYFSPTYQNLDLKPIEWRAWSLFVWLELCGFFVSTNRRIWIVMIAKSVIVIAMCSSFPRQRISIGRIMWNTLLDVMALVRWHLCKQLGEVCRRCRTCSLFGWKQLTLLSRGSKFISSWICKSNQLHCGAIMIYMASSGVLKMH